MMATTAELLASAVEHHQAGRLREAEAIYRQILAIDPAHADAMHLQGVVAHQSGQYQAAVEMIRRAVALSGHRCEFHSNLGEAYRALGQWEDAERCLREALRLSPGFSQAYNNLGLVLRARGDDDAAAAAFERAIHLRPDSAEPHHNLATLLQAQSRWDQAIEHFRQALRYDPSSAKSYNNLGTVLKERGQLAEAAECYERAARLAPGMSEAHFNLGTLHQADGRYQEAITNLRHAIAIRPRYPLARYHLCTALAHEGQLDAMIATCRQAIEREPASATTHFDLGLALLVAKDWPAAAASLADAQRLDPDDAELVLHLAIALQNQELHEEAIRWFSRAIELAPRLTLAHLNRATAYRMTNQTALALAGYQHALELDPRSVAACNELLMLLLDLARPDEAVAFALHGLAIDPASAPIHSNLGRALLQQGRTVEAIAHSRRAVELQPSDTIAHGNLLFRLNYHPTSDPHAVFAEHLAWAARHAEPLTARARPHANDRNIARRLRVGYVSPYFREHAVNFFTEPALLSHDHQKCEVFCYSDVLQTDATTARLREAADHWRDVRKLSDEQLAQQVRNDAIDILVDLTGHLANNRLLAFARKPAPVQVTYIGYQNTTGMTAMDYRLTDERADPPGLTDAYYTERLVRLPRAFFCYQPSLDAPAVTPLPALERGNITFGSFNNFSKVHPRVVATWIEILARVPRSRLLVLAHGGSYVENLFAQAAERRGIDPGRIELCKKRPRGEYLAMMQSVDVALDAFPFNGHTTTCDLLWMGVPVVMLEGQTYASRFGGSALANVGLAAQIADSIEGYVERAVSLANDWEQLAKLRVELRPRMAASVLLDFAGFTRNLETAYRQMWRTWCETSIGQL